ATLGVRRPAPPLRPPAEPLLEDVARDEVRRQRSAAAAELSVGFAGGRAHGRAGRLLRGAGREGGRGELRLVVLAAWRLRLLRGKGDRREFWLGIAHGLCLLDFRDRLSALARGRIVLRGPSPAKIARARACIRRASSSAWSSWPVRCSAPCTTESMSSAAGATSRRA